MLKTEKQTKATRYVTELLNLALPIIMGNLCIILIGAGDVFVAAKHSTDTLAAISIANSIVSTIFMFGVGILASISPLLSNFRGEKNNIKKYFLPTITFSMILAVIGCILILLSTSLIDKIGFEAKLVPNIKNYMFICAFSTFGAYLQIGLKEFLQAYEIVLFPNLLNAFGVILHLFLDFVFVFGLFGFPAMGVIGLAVATIFTRTLLGICLLIFCLRFMRIEKYKDTKYFFNLFKIGLPIAIAILFEFFAFNFITIITGKISGLYAAAQNILITITTATFMVPLAISNAIAVKVGFANGAKNFVDLKKYSFAGVGISVGFMAICALAFLLLPKLIINIFTNDIELVNICVPIMFLAAIFQIFDGLQVSLGGVFKGIKRTNIVMIGDFIAYWVVGLPLGFLFAFKYNMELFGFWVGLTTSIFTLGISFFIILLLKLKQIKRAG